MLRIHDGETVHRFRSGCSITMSLLSVSPENVARHVWWKSHQTTEDYMQTGTVIKMSHAASALVDSASTVAGDPSAAISVTNLFRVTNELGGFSLTSLYDHVLERGVIYFLSFVAVSFLFSVSIALEWKAVTKSHFP